MRKRISMRTMGQLSLFHGDVEIPLPASKKTRALLAYLAITGRPHRREHLCEIFWEIPDDPRGALRWSLSKLRGVLKKAGLVSIVADRERAQLELSAIDVDFSKIRKCLYDEPAELTFKQLQNFADQLGKTLLDGLDLPRQPAFQTWLHAEREDAQLLYTKVLRQLMAHPELGDQEALKWSRSWLEADPFNEKAAHARVTTLRRLGKMDEASSVIGHFKISAADAGLSLVTSFEHLEDDNLEGAINEPPKRHLLRKQNIGFCKTIDGARIAYATVGSGPPIVKAANWLNHLELDWNSPIWGDTFHACAFGRTFIRYDERGNGLSDWEVDEISQRVFVQDLETVVDSLQVEKFPLIGISQGCAVSIEYAVRHPEKVSALILISGYASGWRIGASTEEQERREAVMTLTKLGWGTNNPAYRHIFSQTFMPDATSEELEWFDDFQRHTTSPENAVRFQQAFGDIDVRHLLGQIKVPTIVLHSRNDQRISLEQGKELAIGIPNARFVPLESNNHIILGREPAWQVCLDEINRFLADHKI